MEYEDKVPIEIKIRNYGKFEVSAFPFDLVEVAGEIFDSLIKEDKGVQLVIKGPIVIDKPEIQVEFLLGDSFVACFIIPVENLYNLPQEVYVRFFNSCDPGYLKSESLRLRSRCIIPRAVEALRGLQRRKNKYAIRMSAHEKALQ